MIYIHVSFLNIYAHSWHGFAAENEPSRISNPYVNLSSCSFYTYNYTRISFFPSSFPPFSGCWLLALLQFECSLLSSLDWRWLSHIIEINYTQRWWVERLWRRRDQPCTEPALTRTYDASTGILCTFHTQCCRRSAAHETHKCFAGSPPPGAVCSGDDGARKSSPMLLRSLFFFFIFFSG